MERHFTPEPAGFRIWQHALRAANYGADEVRCVYPIPLSFFFPPFGRQQADYLKLGIMSHMKKKQTKNMIVI